MTRYILGRLLQAVLVLVVSSIVIFLLMRLIPGDPALARAGVDATPETIEAIRRDLGLDQPLPVQYFDWVRSVLTGNLGSSITFGIPVTTLIAQRMMPTLQLIVAALIIAVSSGLVAGVWAAVTKRRWIDHILNGILAVLIGVPVFWFGLLTLIVFSLKLGWLPAGGWVDVFDQPVEGLRALALPASILGLAIGAIIARYVRSAMLETLGAEYVRTARAKGLARRRVWWHAFRSGVLPVMTIIGIQLGRLVGGAVVIEMVFSWPGMGRLIVASVGSRDYVTAEALLLILVGWFILINLLVDVAYGLADPRVRIS